MGEHDFAGYATRANVKCSDGRTITPNAFQHMDKKRVPLVWAHGHDSVANVLGHADLEHRPDGVYCYGFFNTTDNGIHAKKMVQHKDLNSLSIWANQLVEKSQSVLHGEIREVSLCLAGANNGAKIDFIRIQHSDDPNDFELSSDEAIFRYFGDEIEVAHADNANASNNDAGGDPEDLQHVLDSMTPLQQDAVQYLLDQALKQGSMGHSEGDEDDKDEEKDGEGAEDKNIEHKDKDNNTMGGNVFDQNNKGGGGPALATLSHDQTRAIIKSAVGTPSLKQAIIAHAGEYGITNIELLFPDAQAIDNKPEWITRRMEWVEGVINGCKKLPFSRIKSLSADLTHDEARAKGYIKGDVKKEQFFAIASRETLPKTIYKKQKLDRDDIIDITDFDVVQWMWVEMRFMIREEIARAILVGDGREVDDPDKINEGNIRPIAFDDEFYTDLVVLPTNVAGEELVESVLRNRSKYKGSGPTAYMTTDVMMDMLLAKDAMNRRLYADENALAAALRVGTIVEVPVMEDVYRDNNELLMIITNLSDYAIGSTKGGELTTFDDFDIDMNQYKYLIEGRMSGALQAHKRAQVFLRTAGTLVTPTIPTFVSSTGVVTIPSQTGVIYKNQITGDTLTAGAQTALDPGASLSVKAFPASGFYFPHNFDNDWKFDRPSA